VTSSTPDALWASRSVRLLRPSAVTCRGLRRRERRSWVLDGVDLDLDVGTRTLLVSEPEGSASALMRVLASLSRPSRGTFRLAGARRADDSAAGWGRRVAYVGPAAAPFPWLSPGEILELTGRLAGIPPAERRRRIPELVAWHRLEAALHRPLRRAGAAVASRTALAAALLTEPEVLLLDDPLGGELPVERSRLLRIPGERRTVVLASHLPGQEAELVSGVVLLRGGRVALHAPIAALAERGLELSMRGISALAEAGAPERDRRPALAVGG